MQIQWQEEEEEEWQGYDSVGGHGEHSEREEDNDSVIVMDLQVSEQMGL